ncbi:MAG: hypothetical protein ACKONH_01010, partial [Planctomycetia bacterium]
ESFLPPAIGVHATSATTRGDADERAVPERTVEPDRCYVIDRGCATFGLWNAIHAVGSSSVCRVRDKIAATVEHANDLTPHGNSSCRRSHGLMRTRGSLLRSRVLN